MIDLKIKTLLTVAEEKNFTKAAEKLNLTQPAVSHQIKELEVELNTQIFVRRKKDILPTATGEIVLNYAKKILAMYDRMYAEIHDSNYNKINVKVGITHTAESNRTTEVIGTFVNRHKGVSFTITTDTTNNLFQKVENYELDFAIVDQKKNNNLLYLPLDTAYLVCVVNNESPLVKKQMITIEDLKHENLILRLPSSSTRILFDASLESINESIKNFNVILEVDNIATIKELVRKNMGVSILAKSTCMNEVQKNKLTILPIENLSMERRNYFIYNDDFNYVHLIKEINKIYHEKISELL